MALNPPPPIAAYFAAKNRHDIDGMLAPFASNAEVRDEGELHRGRDAIRAWMEHTTKKYRVTSIPEEHHSEDGRDIVRSLVSGDFPGSPAHLTYRFTLAAGEIAALDIG